MNKKNEQTPVEPNMSALDAMLNAAGPIQNPIAVEVETVLTAERKPNPGSEDSLRSGCTCPVEDNKYGVGAHDNTETGEPMFWVNEECPIHGYAAKV